MSVNMNYSRVHSKTLLTFSFIDPSALGCFISTGLIQKVASQNLMGFKDLKKKTFLCDQTLKYVAFLQHSDILKTSLSLQLVKLL